MTIFRCDHTHTDIKSGTLWKLFHCKYTKKKIPLSTKHLQSSICTRRKHIYKFSSEHLNSECSSKNEMYDSFLYQRS